VSAGALPPAPEAESLELRLLTQARLPVTKRLVYQWQHKLTPAGRVALGMVVLGGSVAGNLGPQYPMFVFGLMCLAGLLVHAAVSLLWRPRLRVRRTLPTRCAAGATVRVRGEVENAGRLAAWDVALREVAEPPLLRLERPAAFLDRLGPGERAELDYPVTPIRRGAYDFPGADVVSPFPFGLFLHTRRTPDPARMLVYPRFVPLARLDLPAGRRHQPGGLELVSRVGDSEEFVGLREYRPGDRLRDLHHAAWARLGAPVVREYNQEYLTRIALVVDTWLPRETAATRRAFEAAVSLGAAVADSLSRQEYVVDLFAVGPDVYHFQAGRSLGYLDDILDVLACIEPCRESPFARLGPALGEAVRQISTAVVVLLDWDEERRAFARFLEEHGAETRLFLVRDRPPTLDPTGFTSAGGPLLRLGSAQVEAGAGAL
jgi:uncharacterized protein (DUF58 family)